jgi:hypothetical protein
MLRALNIVPSIHARNKGWFLEPYLVEKADSKHLVYVPSKTSMAGEDGTSEVLRVALGSIDNLNVEDMDIVADLESTKEVFKDELDDTATLGNEVRDVVNNMLDIWRTMFQLPFHLPLSYLLLNTMVIRFINLF